MDYRSLYGAWSQHNSVYACLMCGQFEIDTLMCNSLRFSHKGIHIIKKSCVCHEIKILILFTENAFITVQISLYTATPYKMFLVYL